MNSVYKSWGLVCIITVMSTFVYGLQPADAQVITYRIHPDILTELQDRYPEHAEDYWESVKEAIRNGISSWTELNPNIIATPSHDDRQNVLIEWIDSEHVWGVEYHDHTIGNRIVIDFDLPEPDGYGASLINPDIIQYIMAHELGHVLGMGHSPNESHLMYGTANPTPNKSFDNLGYAVPRLAINNFENIGGGRLNVSFHLQGYHVYDIAVVGINGTNYVVASTGYDGLHVLDVSDSDQPVLVDSDDKPSVEIWPLEVQPYIVQMYPDGFRVLDMSDPTNITLASAVRHNTVLDATLIYVDGKPLLVMVSTGLIEQYDLSNPYDIRRSGAYSDNFNLLGVKDLHGVAHDDGSTYILVDASFDGIQTYLIQPDKNPIRTWDHPNQVKYASHVYEAIEIDDVTYHVTYTHNQIALYEGEAAGEFVGRLLGYTVSEIDTLWMDDSVYAIIAAGPDGILGIHIGDEGVGKWTVG